MYLAFAAMRPSMHGLGTHQKRVHDARGGVVGVAVGRRREAEDHVRRLAPQLEGLLAVAGSGRIRPRRVAGISTAAVGLTGSGAGSVEAGSPLDAVLSPDGFTLYVTMSNAVAALDASTMMVKSRPAPWIVSALAGTETA